jgi:MFS family permease
MPKYKKEKELLSWMVHAKLKLKSRNIRVIYGLKFLGGLVFFIPILALYFEKHLFTLTNVALIFAIRAFAQTIFELPTGAVADLFGRKKTFILAHLSYLLALTFLIIGGNITIFILFALMDAFAKSLKSGTDSSILYDTLRDEHNEGYFKKISGTASAVSHVGIAFGSVASGYLASISLSLPILLSIIPAVLAFVLTFFLQEPRYEKEKHTNVLKHLNESTSLVLTNNQIVLILAGLFIITGVFSTVVALDPIFYRFKHVPIEALGWISAVIFALAAVGYQQSHKLSKIFGDKATIMITVIFPPLTVLLATLFDKWLAVFFMVLSPLFFGLRTPIINDLIHKQVASSKRATVFSIIEMVNKLALAIFAPLAGYLANLYSINVAFQIMAIMLFIVPVIYIFLKVK